jgi:hypothetical protein
MRPDACSSLHSTIAAMKASVAWPLGKLECDGVRIIGWTCAGYSLARRLASACFMRMWQKFANRCVAASSSSV